MKPCCYFLKVEDAISNANENYQAHYGAGALQTAPKELSPSYRDLALPFPGNRSVLFAFPQTSSWEKPCLPTNSVVTTQTWLPAPSGPSPGVPWNGPTLVLAPRSSQHKEQQHHPSSFPSLFKLKLSGYFHS